MSTVFVDDSPIIKPQSMDTSFNRPSALVIAHPGHELRVFSWLEQIRPRVYILTDGSGSNGAARLETSTQTLNAASAEQGPLFGVITDRDAYRVVLRQDVKTTIELVRHLAQDLDDSGIELVMCDEIEGFNPVHDLCGVIVALACDLVQRRTGKKLQCYDFPLEGSPIKHLSSLVATKAKFFHHQLSNKDWQRKQRAIEENIALRAESTKSISAYGVETFKQEVFSPLRLDQKLSMLRQNTPYYESYGEKRVAEGIYNEVLRFNDHFCPLIDQVRERLRNL